MSDKIGFQRTADEWEGPVALECDLDRQHTSLRYTAQLLQQKFTFYPPLELLGAISPSDAPETIVVTLKRTTQQATAVAFPSELRSSSAAAGGVVYDFREAKVNSVRYESKSLKRNSSLYIPNEIFRTHRPPAKVHLTLEVV